MIIDLIIQLKKRTIQFCAQNKKYKTHNKTTVFIKKEIYILQYLKKEVDSNV